MFKMAQTPEKHNDVKDLKYEQAMDELNDILDQIEEGELGLEDSLALTERGVALITHCRGILDHVDARIAQLLVTEDGELANGEMTVALDETEDEDFADDPDEPQQNG